MSVDIPPIPDEVLQQFDSNTLKRIHPETPDTKLEILAGPILRYWGMNEGVYRGSVTYVTRDSKSDYSQFPALKLLNSPTDLKPVRFAEVDGLSFFRFDFDINMHPTQSLEVPYQLGAEHEPFSFWIPGQEETMRTMFYSCNGFSLKVDTNLFPGCLWNDVLRKHEESPIHVMLGGGDQLYCDSINNFLPENTLKNRGKVPEESRMRVLLSKFYLHQYVDWYGRGYWKGLNGDTHQDGWVKTLGTIPSMNIYDDHDIIDGYGTYHDSTMRSPIFEMLGDYAYRYYMYFQQNTSVGVKPNAKGVGDAANSDAIPGQSISHEDPKLNDSTWVTTGEIGPYIHEPARSIYAQLGKTAAFLGLDCRTERKKNQVCTSKTYKVVFDRLRKEFTANRNIKHLYLMLGVPIAYPRMVFAENLMSSNLIGPIKFLSKHGIAFKGLVNPFDGDVELLDDLNDHWCAKHHKHERNWFIGELMELQKELDVRVTILSGDVHLCAVGVFRSLKHVPVENDHHFMTCPVSSAIVNTPPPPTLAKFLNKRNKTHIFHGKAKERMIPMFNVETNGEEISGNRTLMAKRNYCMLDPVVENDPNIGQTKVAGASFDLTKDQKHKADHHDLSTKVTPGSVRMTLHVETDNLNKDAHTSPYTMYIPTLKTIHHHHHKN